MKINDNMKYATKIHGALAAWDDEEKKFSRLTLFGYFPIDGILVEEYTLHFRTEIGFSLCKKLEKEGMADISTDYVRGFVLSEDF